MRPKPQEVMMFVATLQMEMPNQAPQITVHDAKAIMRLGQFHASAAVHLCNVPNYREKYSARASHVVVKLREILKRYGATATVGGDPRGCTVKLILRSKRTNDFGGEGYCVPGA